MGEPAKDYLGTQWSQEVAGLHPGARESSLENEVHSYAEQRVLEKMENASGPVAGPAESTTGLEGGTWLRLALFSWSGSSQEVPWLPPLI